MHVTEKLAGNRHLYIFNNVRLFRYDILFMSLAALLSRMHCPWPSVKVFVESVSCLYDDDCIES